MTSTHFKWISGMPYIYRSSRVVDEKAVEKRIQEGMLVEKKVVRRGPLRKPTKVVSELVAPYWKYYYEHNINFRQIMDIDMVRWMMLNEADRIEYLEKTDTAVEAAKKKKADHITLPDRIHEKSGRKIKGSRKSINL